MRAPFLLLLLLLAPGLAPAQPAPPPGFAIEGYAPDAAPAIPNPGACTPANEGQLACMAGRACACRFERGGQLTGRPDRFAWDCGPLRPDCPAPLPRVADQPASLYYAPAPAFGGDGRSPSRQPYPTTPYPATPYPMAPRPSRPAY